MLKEVDLNLIANEAKLLQEKEKDIFSKAKALQTEMD